MSLVSNTKRDAVFELRDREGLSIKEIALRLQMGHKTVGAILQEGPLCCFTCGEKLYRYDPDEQCGFCKLERELGLV